MKYEITHSCGHTETVQIYGTNVHGERDAKARRMEQRPCAKCAAGAERSHIEEAADLAPLAGSDKQVAWARQIREEAVSRLLADISADGSADDGQKEWMRSLLTEAANSHTRAAWWIDERFGTRYILFGEMRELAQKSMAK